MKLTVTGSRNWKDKQTIYNELDKINPDMIIEGGSYGADAIAKQWAIDNNKSRLTVRPVDSTRKQDYILRNHKMVEIADKVIAFWDGKSKGTKHTIDKARKDGKLLKIVKNKKGNDNDK